MEQPWECHTFYVSGCYAMSFAEKLSFFFSACSEEAIALFFVKFSSSFDTKQSFGRSNVKNVQNEFHKATTTAIRVIHISIHLTNIIMNKLGLRSPIIRHSPPEKPYWISGVDKYILNISNFLFFFGCYVLHLFNRFSISIVTLKRKECSCSFSNNNP